MTRRSPDPAMAVVVSQKNFHTEPQRRGEALEKESPRRARRMEFDSLSNGVIGCANPVAATVAECHVWRLVIPSASPRLRENQ